MTVTYLFQHLRCVTDWHSGVVVTHLADGKEYRRELTEAPLAVALAEQLGYGADLRACQRETELLLTWLAERLGQPCSRWHFWLTRGCEEIWPDRLAAQALAELQLVYSFQRCLNDPALARLLPAIAHGAATDNPCWVEWQGLRRQAWRLFRRLPAQEEEHATVDTRGIQADGSGFYRARRAVGRGPRLGRAPGGGPGR